MDALDAKILWTLGVEPFASWPPAVKGLRAADVARKVGQNVRLVQDRIARMEADGVIQGYTLFPNLRHVGLGVTVFHMLADQVRPDEDLERLSAVDGFVGLVSYVGPGLCLNVFHGDARQRDRRVEVIGRLVASQGQARPLYEHAFPRVERRLSPLDWRIIQAMMGDARRPVHEVAEQVGVTAKTVRTRLNAMRKEGSIDECARVDLTRITGILPYELAVWADEGADAERALLKEFEERYLIHFRPPEGGYCDVLLRVFAYTPAEVQSMVVQAKSLDGVSNAESLMAAGAVWNHHWLPELVEAHAQGPATEVP